MLGREQVAYLVKKKKKKLGVLNRLVLQKPLVPSGSTIQRFHNSTLGLSGSASIQLIVNPKGRTEPERSPIDSLTGLTNRSSLVCKRWL